VQNIIKTLKGIVSPKLLHRRIAFIRIVYKQRITNRPSRMGIAARKFDGTGGFKQIYSNRRILRGNTSLNQTYLTILSDNFR